jgi:hypothetical protein
MSHDEQLDRLLPPDPAVGRVEPLPAALAVGVVPADLPRHLRDRLAEPPGPDRSAQTAGLVAAAVEWGLDDPTVLALALAHLPTQQRRRDTAKDVTRLIGKYRPGHQHVGQPCDKATCPNAPPWMGSSPARPARREQPSTVPASVDDLVKVLAGYQHLDDPGHVWFALAVAVSGLAFDDDPLWGMLVGPASSGKTETTRILSGIAGHVDDLTASSLLSWTKGKTPRPTGILTRIGERGILTVGDFSTVLAMSNKGGRDQLFANLRRVYDGHLTRDLGNAEEPLRWRGRLTILACCTPVIDQYAAHADALGPRWLYYRFGRKSTASKRAMGNVARGESVRDARSQAAELAAAILKPVAVRARSIRIPQPLGAALVETAIVACLGRAAVPRNGYGRRDIEGIAVPEDPPRLVKQLEQLVGGLLALGMDEHRALALARRAALDSMPQARRGALEALVDNQRTVSEVAQQIGCDRKVARMALEELRAIGVASCPVEDDAEDDEELGRWTPRLWQLDGPDQQLIVDVLTAQPWDEKLVASPHPPQDTRVPTGAYGEASHFSSQGPPAGEALFDAADHTPDDPRRFAR